METAFKFNSSMFNRIIPDYDPEGSDSLLEQHLANVEASEREESRHSTIRPLIAKAKNKFVEWKERHPKTARAIKVIGTALLAGSMIYSINNILEDMNSYVEDKDNNLMNVSTEEATENLDFSEFTDVSDFNDLGLKIGLSDIGLKYVQERINTSYVNSYEMPNKAYFLNISLDPDGLCGGTTTDIEVSGSDLYLSLMQLVNNNESLIEEQRLTQMVKDLGYDIQLERSGESIMKKYSGMDKDGISATVSTSPAFNSHTTYVRIKLKYDISSEVRLNETVQHLKDRGLYNENAVNLHGELEDLITERTKLIRKVEEVPAQEIEDVLENTKFVPYWELPSGKVDTNVTKYLLKDLSKPRGEIWVFNPPSPQDWMGNGRDKNIIENGSLVKVLEKIEDYTSETSEYSGVEERTKRFVCEHYSEKYIWGFDTAKEINPNLENVHIFRVVSSKSPLSDNGHEYIGILSLSENKSYVSFVEPTWADSVNPFESEREKFDALDGEHYIALPNTPELQKKAAIDKEAKEQSRLINEAKITTKGIGIIALNYALKKKKIKKKG